VEAELGKAAGEDMAATREAFRRADCSGGVRLPGSVITYGNDIKAAHGRRRPFP